MRLTRLRLENFLSYREASVELGRFVAIVGANASGKSNAVAALKLLHDIPSFGLPLAIARRGGFDQLRHRSRGRPYDPSIEIEFETVPGGPPSRYGLKLGALAGKRYEVKNEWGHVVTPNAEFSFRHTRGRLEVVDQASEDAPKLPSPPEGYKIPPGQSALQMAASPAAFHIWQLLSHIRVVSVSPQRVSELQEPSSTREFETDGSNAASFLQLLSATDRAELIDELAGIVPGVSRVEARHMADKLALVFYQLAGGKQREFNARSMSDGTLRAFAILLSVMSRPIPELLVIEEPEIAIHLGALRTLVDLLRQHSEEMQILITTHSADIVDALDISELRVVSWEDGSSTIRPVAEHTVGPVREGLITPGELLRSNALDPA